ncbi:hypothetical protein [Brunnivagina elsteri]|uniref:Uncharacterized protein n=1 Tax=Brunnivagina elsteri CCALA 953 TaxID=987040 RepID=A0A2A2THS1_9CYAN|nr:hypothetical protein [Calothrix elsteri]PAX53178.1 hypothetical protein CK510_15415 [Calothrix elsteri CCALA 953]
MNLKTIVTTAAFTGLVTISGATLNTISPQSNQAFAKEAKVMLSQATSKAEMKDATGLTVAKKIEMLTKHKGMFGSGDQLRRYFFGDLEPIAVQPGGAGMVVNLYNKANNTTFAYCATYDVVVAIKEGKVKAFAPSEVK